MGWALESICEWFLKVVTKMLTAFSGAFIDQINLDIGYTYSKMSEVGFKGSKGDVGFFEQYFPGILQMKYVFLVTGCAIVFIIMMFKILQSFWGPLMNGEGENPIAVIAKSIMATILVMFSYQIFVFFEKPISLLYEGFKQVGRGTGGTGIHFGKQLSESDGLIQSWGNGIGASDVVATIILVIACVALLIEFIKLLLEIVERYVFLAVMYYTAPLVFAALASKSTRNIFTSWCRMLASQFILFLMSSFFINVFISALNYLSGKSFKPFPGLMSFIIWLFMMIAWLKIGQRMDQYLDKLGMSTMQCGGGIAEAIMGTYATVRMASSAGKALKSALPGGGKGGQGGGSGSSATDQWNENRKDTAQANKMFAAGNLIRDHKGNVSKGEAMKAWNAKNATLKGKDAEDALEHKFGFSKDKLREEFPGYDPNKTEFGGGRAVFKDSAGRVIGGIGEEGSMKDGVAYHKFDNQYEDGKTYEIANPASAIKHANIRPGDDKATGFVTFAKGDVTTTTKDGVRDIKPIQPPNRTGKSIKDLDKK